MIKKILSVILIIITVLSIPGTVFAENEKNETTETVVIPEKKEMTIQTGCISIILSPRIKTKYIKLTIG